MKFRLALALAVTFASLTLLTTPAFAIDSFGVGAKPANPDASNQRTQSIFIYSLAPGASANDGIVVANNTNESKTISVYPVDSVRSSDGAFACAQAADAKQAVGKWINLSSSTVELEANSKTTVPFTVAIPADASVGEHDGCIAVQANNPATVSDKNGIALSFRSAIRVAITVPGKITYSLAGTNLKTLVAAKKVTVSPTFHNSGNVSVDAAITASVSGLGAHGSTKGTFPVLRDSDGTFNFELPRPFWGGIYTIKSVASYKPLESAGNSKDAAPLTKSVFIPPAPAALAIELAVLVVVLGLIALLVGRRIQRRNHARFSSKHVVAAGEDIQSIAADYGVSWKLLSRMNNIKAPYTLHTGQTILIPGKKPKPGHAES